MTIVFPITGLDNQFRQPVQIVVIRHYIKLPYYKPDTPLNNK